MCLCGFSVNYYVMLYGLDVCVVLCVCLRVCVLCVWYCLVCLRVCDCGVCGLRTCFYVLSVSDCVMLYGVLLW